MKFSSSTSVTNGMLDVTTAQLSSSWTAGAAWKLVVQGASRWRADSSSAEGDIGAAMLLEARAWKREPQGNGAWQQWAANTKHEGRVASHSH